MTDHPVARRTVIKSAGLGIGAGLASGITSAQAQSRGCGAAARDQERRVLGAQGQREARHVPQAAHRAGSQRAASAGAVSGARLVERGAQQLRPDRAGQGRIFDDERVRPLRLRRVDHGPRRLRQFRQLRQQFGYRQRRRGFEGGDAGGDAGDRPAKNSFLRHVVRRHPRRGLCAGAARARRSAGALRLHLQGRRRRGDPAAAEEHRGAARQSAAQARRQHDPLDLHPRRASRAFTIPPCPKRSSPPR